MADPESNAKNIKEIVLKLEQFDRSLNEEKGKQSIKVIDLDPNDSTLTGKLIKAGRLIALCDTDDAAFTVDLPALQGTKLKMLTIKKNSVGTNDVTIHPFPGDKIDLLQEDYNLVGALLPAIDLVPNTKKGNWAIV